MGRGPGLPSSPLSALEEKHRGAIRHHCPSVASPRAEEGKFCAPSPKLHTHRMEGKKLAVTLALKRLNAGTIRMSSYPNTNSRNVSRQVMEETSSWNVLRDMQTQSASPRPVRSGLGYRPVTK